MPNLGDTPSRFESIYHTDDGRQFRASLSVPSDREPANLMFNRNRRLLRVREGQDVRLRDRIYSVEGVRFLVGASTASEWAGRILYRLYRLFEVDDVWTWSRKATIIDSLTGLPKETTSTILDQAWLVIEPDQEDIDRAMHIHQERLRLITDSHLQEGDRIGTRIVKRSNELLGLTFVEAQ